MSTSNYQGSYADALKALDEEGPKNTVLPDGQYRVKIANVKPGQSKNNQFRFGVRFTVLEGPYEGQSTWVNQTFVPDKPVPLAIALRLCMALGVPRSAVDAGVPPELLVEYIVPGTTGTATFGSHSYGEKDGKPRMFQDLKKFDLDGGSAPAPTPAAAPQTPTPAAVPQPEAAPAPTPGSAPTPF